MCSALLRGSRYLRHSRSVFAYRHMGDGWNKWKRGKRGETPDLCAGKARAKQAGSTTSISLVLSALSLLPIGLRDSHCGIGEQVEILACCYSTKV